MTISMWNNASMIILFCDKVIEKVEQDEKGNAVVQGLVLVHENKGYERHLFIKCNNEKYLYNGEEYHGWRIEEEKKREDWFDDDYDLYPEDYDRDVLLDKYGYEIDEFIY